MWTPKDEYTPEAHLAQITAVLGSIPKRLLDRSKKRDRYFNADGIDSIRGPPHQHFFLQLLTYSGNLLRSSTFPPCSLGQFSKNTDLSGVEKEGFLGFIRSMVSPDPEDRPDASKLLESPWLAR